MTELDNFLYPYSRYQSRISAENLMFNANLQEFSQRVSYICSLETGGKLTPNESFQQIRSLWHELKHSYQQLGIGE